MRAILALLLLAAGPGAADLKCTKSGGSPGREIVCYTGSAELGLLENAICRCTALVHQGHDLQRLNASVTLDTVYAEGCPAAHFYLDCNRCFCKDKENEAPGIVCTLMACRPPPVQIVNWHDGLNCPAGQEFFYKCNNCVCNEDGKSASCTDLPCPNPNEGALTELRSLRDSAKAANPSLRLLVSVTDERGLLKGPADQREEATALLTNALKEVDGVELNMTAGSKDRLVSFVKGLKDEMVNASLEKMILLALPTIAEDLAKQFELKELSKYVDLFTVATHYLTDSDEAYKAFHPSRLMGLFDMLNTDSLVDLISGMGAPKDKILISAPASAYQFKLKKAEENAPRSPTEEKHPLALDRQKLCEAISDGEWMVERDEDLTAPYAFKNTTWIAFEDETSLKIKGKYVIIRELGGMGLRDVEKDLKTDCGASAAESVYRAFVDMKRKTRDLVLSSLERDLKGSEISYPRHVRSSDYRIVRVVDTEGKIRAVRENTQTAFTCTRQGYFVHPKSCNRFYRCVKFNQEVENYSVFEFDCPAGLAFDEHTEVCVWPGSVSSGSACHGSSEIEPVSRARFRCPNHPGFYADPQNCRWFFACYDLGGPEMVPYEFRCPFGLVFDEQRLVCEWPWKVPNCANPNDGHNIYTFGGAYGGSNEGNIPVGELIGQSGFINQGEYSGPSYSNVGQDYDQGQHAISFGSDTQGHITGTGNDDQLLHAPVSGAGYGPIYNQGGTTGTGIYYNGQPHIGDSITGSRPEYPVQNVYPGSDAVAGTGYGGQIENSGGETVFNGPTYNPNGKNYNQGGAINVDQGFGEQSDHSAGGIESGVGYNGQTYPADGVHGNTGIDATYDDQNYGPKYSSSGLNFGGQTYNSNGGIIIDAGKGLSFGSNEYDGQYHIRPTALPAPGKDCNDVHSGSYLPPAPQINYGGKIPIESNVNYGGQPYGGQPYGGQPYSGQTPVGHGITYNGQNVNAPGFSINGYHGQYPNVGGPYDNRDNIGSIQSNADGQDYINQGVTVGFNNVKGVDINVNGFDSSKINTGDIYNDKGITTSAPDYDDRGGVTPIVEYNGQNNFANGVTTVSHNNLAGVVTTTPRYPIDASSGVTTIGTTGSTYGGSVTNKYPGSVPNEYSGGVTTGYVTDTLNNFAGNTDFSGGVTSQNGLITGPKYATSYANSIMGFKNSEYDKFPKGQNNNFNAQPNNFGSTNTGYSTISYGNTATGLGFGNSGLTEFGNTQYTGFTGPTVYNATYNSGAGHPTSTIIPFVPQQNTVNGLDYQGISPVNSVIYHSHVAMGLANAENFGTQYTNQAGKSFVTQVPTPSGFAFNRPQNQQGFNIVPNTYSPKPNLGGITPSITIIRDGSQNNGATTGGYSQTYVPYYQGSTVAPENFNENSQIIGSSITSANNDINKFHESTEVPDYFNGNTPDNTAYRPDFNGGPLYQQGTTSNQNPYINTGFGQKYSQNLTPTTIAQKLVTQGTTVPTVAPLNNPQSTIELDNSGLFGSTTFAPSPRIPIIAASTATASGYRTNEYFDNGGRGTIRYNNGLIANKVTDKDIQDYKSATYTSIPSSFIISSGSGDSTQSTIIKANSDNPNFVEAQFTREGFTKTGPTKTGITTAQVGGSGSYVIGNRFPRPKPNPQLIGEQAFAGDFSSTVTPSNFGVTGTTSNFVPNGGNSIIIGSSPLPADFSNLNLGNHENPQGYSYPRPAVQLEINGVSTTPISQSNYVDVTTPSAFFNAESYDDRNSVIIETNPQNTGGFSSTVSPIAYTTGQLENFKTTIFQAAKLPQSITTVRPVIDTGSRTVISSTPVPAILSTQTYQQGDYSTRPRTSVGLGASFDQANEYGSTDLDSSSFDYSDIIPNEDQGTFGQKVAGQTRFTNTNYQQTTISNKEINQNSKIITTTPGYNVYTGTGIDSNIETGTVRPNQSPEIRPVVTNAKEIYIPSSTLTPVIGTTFSKPIVAAEFSRGSIDLSSGAEITQKSNTANFIPRGSPTRILNNQTPSGFAHRQPPNRILVNQAPAGSNNGFFNNQAAGNFGFRESNRIIINQASPNAFPQQNQGFNGQTRTLVGSNVVTSIGDDRRNNDILRQNAINRENLKIVSHFNGVNNVNIGKMQPSTTIAPEITTYIGDFGKTRTLIDPNAAPFNAVNQNKKVIVKLSDLHPLILGKLGAECTCKADPFAAFRGPNRQRFPINSQNRGYVDLANYDESDIYVDVDSDKANDFIQNIPSNRLIKNSRSRINGGLDDKSITVTSRGEPFTSTYLPPTTARPSSTYLPVVKPSNAYLPPFVPALSENQSPLITRSQNQQLLIRVEDNNANRAISGGRRSGKSLFDSPVGSPNELKNQARKLDAGAIRTNDEALESSLDCARPGLFRHPKFCNKFYACHWDEWKKRFTLHVFNCPVHLAFDASAGACNYPSKGPACQDNKLLL